MDRMIKSEAVEAAPFLFVGEHVALDFANTLMAAEGEPVETLVFFADVLRWLEMTKLISKPEKQMFAAGLAGAAAQGRLLDQIRELRGHWKHNLERLISGKDATDELVGQINRHLKEDLSWQILNRQGKMHIFRVDREHVSLDVGKKILAILAGRMADFLAAADLKYLRRCAGPDCVLFFYDTTKSHRRQWCSMAICGNRHKVAKFRAKKTRRTHESEE
jgi:predicted RNA-binding Zn ribbon-like protein